MIIRIGPVFVFFFFFFGELQRGTAARHVPTRGRGAEGRLGAPVVTVTVVPPITAAVVDVVWTAIIVGQGKTRFAPGRIVQVFSNLHEFSSSTAVAVAEIANNR